jgi:GT2 family glycosyltransferase
MTRVDLVIPTYNGGDLLEACLRSLMASTFTDYRLIVVDDGSDQPIREITRSVHPHASVLRHERNMRFAAACNAGIDTGHGEYVVLLNNDTEVEPTWLAELVAQADRWPDAGSIASKIRLAGERARLHSAGDYWSVRGMPGNRGVWLEDVGQYDTSLEVFSACAGAALYRRSALDAVRLKSGDIFDSRLCMYCEDVDLGWRLQLAGRPCVFAPSAVVYHHLSATGGGVRASYFVSRNIWLLMARTIPSEFVRPYRSRIAAFQAGRALRAVWRFREPAARAQLRGTFAGLAAFALARSEKPGPSAAEAGRIRSLIIG